MKEFFRVGMILVVSCGASGQADSPVGSFEVASIRPRVGPYSRIGVSTSGPRLRAEAMTVRALILYAYDVQNSRLPSTAALSAVGDTPYDVEAKAEGERAPTQAEFRQLMRSLLADRFRLKLHHEMRPTAIYALIVGRGGPKFKESTPGASTTGHTGISGPNNVLTLPASTMEGFVRSLANAAFLDRPVVDRTGLSGTYEIRLTYTPENRIGRAVSDPAEITVFTAVSEQLGLRLVPQQAELLHLVVDHVEKPTGN